MKYFLGCLVILLTFLLSILILGEFIGSSIAEFIDAPSLIPFIIVNSAVIVMSGDFKIHIKATNALLSKKYVISAADKEKAIALYTLMSKVTIGTTIMLIAIGLVMMFGRLEDPNMLGPMVAVSLISLIYGAFINLMILPAIYILKNRPNLEPVSVLISEKQVIDKLLELCYKQGISPEEILDAKEIAFRNPSN